MDFMLFKQRLKVIPLIFFFTLKIIAKKCAIIENNNNTEINLKKLNTYKNKKK